MMRAELIFRWVSPGMFCDSAGVQLHEGDIPTAEGRAVRFVYIVEDVEHDPAEAAVEVRKWLLASGAADVEIVRRSETDGARVESAILESMESMVAMVTMVTKTLIGKAGPMADETTPDGDRCGFCGREGELPLKPCGFCGLAGCEACVCRDGDLYNGPACCEAAAAAHEDFMETVMAELRGEAEARDERAVAAWCSALAAGADGSSAMCADYAAREMS